MTTEEARRHGLCNVPTAIIGAEETDTLMAYLPTQPHEVLATRADVEALGVRVERLESRVDSTHREMVEFGASLRSEMGRLRTELRAEMGELRTNLSSRIDSVNERLDRLFLTLAAGLLAVVGTVVVQVSE